MHRTPPPPPVDRPTTSAAAASAALVWAREQAAGAWAAGYDFPFRLWVRTLAGMLLGAVGYGMVLVGWSFAVVEHRIEMALLALLGLALLLAAFRVLRPVLRWQLTHWRQLRACTRRVRDARHAAHRAGVTDLGPGTFRVLVRHHGGALWPLWAGAGALLVARLIQVWG